jgi:hypothetical protein
MYLTSQEMDLIRTVAPAVLTLMGALGAVHLTGLRDDRRLREERDRQDALDREQRWADARLAAHTAFLQASMDTLQWCESGGPADHHSPAGERPTIEVTIAAMVRRLKASDDALARLQPVVRLPVRTVAAETILAIRQASSLAAIIGTGTATVEQLNAWHESCGQARATWDAYLGLAQDELGTA